MARRQDVGYEAPAKCPSALSLHLWGHKLAFPSIKGRAFQRVAGVGSDGFGVSLLWWCGSSVQASYLVKSNRAPASSEAQPLLHEHESRLGNHSGKEIQEISANDSEKRGRG